MFLIFTIVYTSASAILWNEGYADNIKEIIHIIVKGAVPLGSGIWKIARHVGALAQKIPNETVCKVVQMLITVLVGVTAAGVIVLRKIIKKLIKHWKEINMWDMTSLVTAAVLFGMATLLPASNLNWLGIGIVMYIACIILRSLFYRKKSRIKP